MTLDENLELLEDWIRRLKVEYDIFFAGAVRKPPYDLRNRVDSLLKRLLDEKKMSVTQRYRYNSLVARYSAYRDLWRRLVQEKELGVSPEPLLEGRKRATPDPTTERSAPPVSRPAPPLRSRPAEGDAAAADLPRSLHVQIADPAGDAPKVQELYNFLIAAQSRVGEKKILPFDAFRSLVAVQATKLRETLGCRSITFTVSIEKTKVKFTAKAGDS